MWQLNGVKKGPKSIPFSIWKYSVANRKEEAFVEILGPKIEELEGESDGVGGAEICWPGDCTAGTNCIFKLFRLSNAAF